MRGSSLHTGLVQKNPLTSSASSFFDLSPPPTSFAIVCHLGCAALQSSKNTCKKSSKISWSRSHHHLQHLMGIVFCHKQKKYIHYIYIYVLYILYITCIHLARRLSCVHSLRNIISIAMYISISKTGWENQFAQKLTFVYPSPPKPKIEKKNLKLKGFSHRAA